jgi:3-deoxy-7-phosphoheptulonate synthase
MLVIMNKNASKKQIDAIITKVNLLNFKAEKLPGSHRTAIGIMGNADYQILEQLSQMEGVKELLRVTKPYKLVSREFKPQNTIVKITDTVKFNHKKPIIIAGPCSVESKDQLFQTAKAVKKAGAHMLRGGAFKPRTSPYSFQGLGEEGLKLLKKASKEFRLPVVTELISTDDIPLFKKYVDMIQIGARNMHNFHLLQKAAESKMPILLKRGMSATMEEFLLAAEYILNAGNPNVVLCERGIRTFEYSTRNILDLNTLTLIQKLSHLPIIADPSHAAGRYDLVAPLAKSAIGAGAHGLIIEVHNNPQEALSDGKQSLTTKAFEYFMNSL